MARQGINTGSAPNDGTGDNLRKAGGKINDNFIELYALSFGNGSTLSRGTWDLTSAGINTLSSVGIGTTNPQGTLQVGTAITMDGTSGIITAISFSGDGSSLTGLTGASAATYGDASNVAQIVVDSNGRITGISEVSISGGGGGSGGSSKWADYDTSTGISTTKKVKIENDLEVTGVTTTTTLAVSGVATAASAVIAGIITANSTGIDVGAGIITATSFVGSGEGITGIAATDNIVTGTAATFTNNVNISGVTTVGVLTAYTSVTVGTAITADAASGIITATGVNVTGVVTATSFLGNVTGNATGLSGTPDINVRNITGVAATFTGVLTYEDVTNVDSLGIVTARGGFEIGASGVGGTITAVGNAEFAGIVTATNVSVAQSVTSGTFYGDASDITEGQWTLGASGTNHYTFTGPGLDGSQNDPTLYLQRGKTYKFVNGMGAHPFQIQSTFGSGGSAYTDGVTNNGASNGTVTLEVRQDAPDSLYYQCTSHVGMGGTFTITGSGIPIGGIIMWSGVSVPAGWALCNGSNGTPDLRNRFIVGSGDTYSIADTGGSAEVTLTVSQLPAHTHSAYTEGTGTPPGGVATSSGNGSAVDTGSAGGGQAHENRPPYYALAFIMKL
jgi:microcystin-dependent protein|tara:strand:- start:253 stop:2106 length:1854 start_codon:yes stop_codon:yes gene_type:complete